MQEVIERILQGSKTDAQYVLDMSIETLQGSEYTLDDDMLGDLDKLRADAITKLVACSKELSLRYLSLMHGAIDRRSAKVIERIVFTQKDQDVLDIVNKKIIQNLQNGLSKDLVSITKLVACSKELTLRYLSLMHGAIDRRSAKVIERIVFTQKDQDVLDMVNKKIIQNLQNGLSKDLVSLVKSIPNFVADNLDLFLTLAQKHLCFEDVSSVLLNHNYESITNKQYFKICELYLSRVHDVEKLGFKLLKTANKYGERPVHYEVLNKIMMASQSRILHISVQDLFSLMQEYTPEFRLLKIKTPKIKGNEQGIEHCVKYLECLANYNRIGDVYSFLFRVEDISPFFHILLEHLDEDLIESFLSKNLDKRIPNLPRIVDLVLQYMKDSSETLLKFLYSNYDNKEEFKDLVMSRVENVTSLPHWMISLILYMFDGDLPIKNVEVLRSCWNCFPTYLVPRLSPKYTKIMLNYMLNNNRIYGMLDIYHFDNVRAVCHFDNVHKLDQFFVDQVISYKNIDYQGTLWYIAEKLKSEYAVEHAWDYTDLPQNYILSIPILRIHAIIKTDWAPAPDDNVADDFLRRLIKVWPGMIHVSYRMIKAKAYACGEVMAYLYNNTGCEIHMTLIKSVMSRYGNVPTVFSLSIMVLNLNKLDHKEELRSLLTRGLFWGDSRQIAVIKSAIARLGGGDECNILPKQIKKKKRRNKKH